MDLKNKTKKPDILGPLLVLRWRHCGEIEGQKASTGILPHYLSSPADTRGWEKWYCRSAAKEVEMALLESAARKDYSPTTCTRRLSRNSEGLRGQHMALRICAVLWTEESNSGAFTGVPSNGPCCPSERVTTRGLLVSGTVNASSWGPLALTLKDREILHQRGSHQVEPCSM